jgi:CRP-like cAMP-binding protein
VVLSGHEFDRDLHTAEEEKELAPTAELLARLPAYPLFAAVSPWALREVIDAAELVELAPGARLIEKGAPADALYILVEGAVRVVLPESMGAVILTEGDVVGEACVVESTPRSADVVVEQPLTALRLATEPLARLSRRWPEISQILVSMFVRRRLTSFLGTSPLFRPLEPEFLVGLSEHFEARLVPAGAVLVDAGANANGLYVPLSGHCELRQGAEVVGVRRPEDVDLIGASSLIMGAPEPYDVVTSMDMAVFWLPAPALKDLIERYPRVVAQLEEHRRELLAKQ